ncbi:hypothetical protein SAMN05421812_11763 [Asanoa hainanensis]|uniref:Glycosyltransferase n=1 Tax=Asanoa hainanensis TaxID=560556 RepID=A0A239PC30_9ACTN|nr:TIGR04282 family arsenosugar biosynthesis glycosyltransferase [Asanoa hainanensis]SNT64502.1 hypothetical protein SAMN05421812_11763 [Asanoa hainanensis]
MTQLVVVAKAPVPGRVKTRLCPPCRPDQAALVAAAALADSLAAGGATAFDPLTLLLDGRHPAPPGWRAVPQRGGDLGDRLAHGFGDSAVAGHGTVLIGMDTPQVTAELLDAARRELATVDAVLGPAEDGGWWALGLRDPRDAVVLRAVPMSTPDTGALTLAALCRRGLRVGLLPTLRDVDTAADAHAVARSCRPGSAFARAVATHVPVGVGA